MERDADPRVTFLGHATVAIDMDGQRILTDPILRSRVGPLVRMRGPVEEQHWSGTDAVLISHSHWDHLDYGSLAMLGTATHIVVPRGMRAGLRRRGFERVTEVEVGDEVDLGSLRVVTVHAEHRGFGPPVGGTERSVGYVIAGSAAALLRRRHRLSSRAWRSWTGIDLALVPVWGWGPTAKPSEHLDPLRCGAGRGGHPASLRGAHPLGHAAPGRPALDATLDPHRPSPPVRPARATHGAGHRRARHAGGLHAAGSATRPAAAAPAEARRQP